MKYKLLKDLPFARAGTEVISLTKNANYSYDLAEIKGDTLSVNQTIRIPKEVTDEWIEEVKPREWYLAIGHDNQGVFAEPYSEGRRFGKLAGVKEIIKVREVIYGT